MLHQDHLSAVDISLMRSADLVVAKILDLEARDPTYVLRQPRASDPLVMDSV